MTSYGSTSNQHIYEYVTNWVYLFIYYTHYYKYNGPTVFIFYFWIVVRCTGDFYPSNKLEEQQRSSSTTSQLAFGYWMLCKDSGFDTSNLIINDESAADHADAEMFLISLSSETKSWVYVGNTSPQYHLNTNGSPVFSHKQKL